MYTRHITQDKLTTLVHTTTNYCTHRCAGVAVHDVLYRLYPCPACLHRLVKRLVCGIAWHEVPDRVEEVSSEYRIVSIE